MIDGRRKGDNSNGSKELSIMKDMSCFGCSKAKECKIIRRSLGVLC